MGQDVARAKKQHYVPRSYLKRFTADGKSIYVLDKKARRAYQSSTSNVATKNFFYDLPPDLRWDSQAVEKSLSILEAKYDAAIRDLLDEVRRFNGFTPGRNERNELLAHFVLMQHVRTPSYRESMERAGNQLQEFATEIMTAEGATGSEATPRQ